MASSLRMECHMCFGLTSSPSAETARGINCRWCGHQHCRHCYDVLDVKSDIPLLEYPLLERYYSFDNDNKDFQKSEESILAASSDGFEKVEVIGGLADEKAAGLPTDENPPPYTLSPDVSNLKSPGNTKSEPWAKRISPVKTLSPGKVMATCCRCKAQEDVTFVVESTPPCSSCYHSRCSACDPRGPDPPSMAQINRMIADMQIVASREYKRRDDGCVGM
ncbi:hypothetical protein GLAREA_11481 [Glarea lozoyensis ATCC 20868]|uniref:Uncharacterized protein n=1 Tax=Glarea lozoyensis (strain ATCC 20868 / MF5171) TaxID=1116229 RepID=S3CG74_GLAL2|nr:uncharacterized protein GLAREA_11481 [Glarea lozoyensis ATCC 20868]EPE24900.1 hypothetical protein GLAREA_11481 [Glarea lozoyensis ATCC 20868]